MVVIRVETVFSLHGLSDQQPKTKHRMSAKVFDVVCSAAAIVSKKDELPYFAIYCYPT